MRTKLVFISLILIALFVSCQRHEALPTAPESLATVESAQANGLKTATNKERGSSSAREIEGTITEIAADGSSITVHDSHGHDTVLAIAPTTIIRKNDHAAKLSDLAVNDHVEVKATTVNNVLTAAFIEVEQGERAVAFGTVKSVGTDSIVVTTRSGDVTVKTDANTTIVRDGQKAALSDLQSGDQVAAAGTRVDSTTILAKSIVARSANAPVPMVAEGTVKSVGATSLVITTHNGDITVNTDANTVIVRNGQKATLADIKQGDEAAAAGTKIDATTMLAKTIAAHTEENEPPVNVMFAEGTVKSVGANSVVITTHSGDITVNTDSNTVITRNGQKAMLADLQTGDEAVAVGTKVDATTMLAKTIAAHVEENPPLPNVMIAVGTVKSVNGSSFVVTTRSGDITVNTDSNTVVFKDGRKIAVGDIQVNDQVAAGGTKVNDTTLLAKVIQVGGSGDHHD